eukprot:1156119-Pelagomonas_calceolata.AAC.4
MRKPGRARGGLRGLVDKASCGLGCAPWGGASLRSLDLLAGSSSASLLVPDGVTEGGGSGCCGGCLAGGDAGLSGGWLAGAEVSCCCRWGSTVPPDSTVKSPIGRVLVEPTACTDVEGSRAAEGRETAPAMCLSPGADVGAGAAERGCCGLRLLLKHGQQEGQQNHQHHPDGVVAAAAPAFLPHPVPAGDPGNDGGGGGGDAVVAAAVPLLADAAGTVALPLAADAAVAAALSPPAAVAAAPAAPASAAAASASAAAAPHAAAPAPAAAALAPAASPAAAAAAAACDGSL